MSYDVERHGLLLPDNAEPRRRNEHHSAVAFTRMPGDERMHGGGKSERARVCRHVVHAAMGQEDRARDLLRRHIGERLAERREQARAVALSIRLAGFDQCAVRAPECAAGARSAPCAPFRSAPRVRRSSACALVEFEHVNEVRHSRSSRVNEGYDQRGDDEGEGERAKSRATAAGEEQQHNDDRRRGERGPQHIGGNERRE